jgi:hypothetical protein
MVSNPRTVMMCGLLVLAAGAALGSRLAPTARGDAPAAVPAFAGWNWPWAGHEPVAGAAARAAGPTEAAVDTTADAVTAPGIEGDRRPRMPRMSRDTMARPSR